MEHKNLSVYFETSEKNLSFFILTSTCFNFFLIFIFLKKLSSKILVKNDYNNMN